jgi:hypothetical protein
MPYERERITKRLGTGQCANCGFKSAQITQMKNGLLCSSCPDPFDGGCRTQVKADSEAGALLIAGRCLKWRDRKDKERILEGRKDDQEPAGDDTDSGDSARDNSGWGLFE